MEKQRPERGVASLSVDPGVETLLCPLCSLGSLGISANVSHRHCGISKKGLQGSAALIYLFPQPGISGPSLGYRPGGMGDSEGANKAAVRFGSLAPSVQPISSGILADAP